MPFQNNRKNLTIAWLAVAAVVTVAGVWRYQAAYQTRLDDVAADASRTALALQNEEFGRLSGTRADEGTPLYARLKQRLVRINDVYSKFQYVYAFRVEPESREPVCLMDSEPPDSPRIIRPGDPFPGVINDGDVMRTVREGVVTFNESQRDANGSWISAYALVADDPRTLLRFDADIAVWRLASAREAALAAFLAWLLLGLPLAAYLLARRYTRQSLSIQKLSVAMEQSATAMMIVDAAGCIEYVNAGLCALTYYSRGDLVGSNWVALSGAQPSDAVPKVLQMSREGKTWSEDFDLGRKDGSSYPARVTSTPVRGHGGQIIAYIVVITDLTELRRQARELRVAKERAESADHAKGVFLATMSHEVRTPLNGIVGFSDLLLDTHLTPEQREYVLAIHTSGETLMQLTGDILDYSRIESGRLRLEAELCDVDSVVEEALDIVAPRAAGKKLQLLYSIDSAVPSHVLIDGGRLRQVLVNLIGNAIKFTPSGEVEVSVRATAASVRTGLTAAPFPAQGDKAVSQTDAADFDAVKLLFDVRDTGIGIAPENQMRLFKPFVQLDSSNARRYGGAGLGLVISSDLVRLMGGGISVVSEVGKGTTFSFAVRCSKPGEVLLEPRFQKKRLAGRHVAIVSTHAGLCRELARELQSEGATAAIVGLEEIAGERWDLAVVDCEEATIAYLRQYITVPERWRGDCMISLVDIGLDSQQRQVLRPFFRALMSKPAHHKMLIDKLARKSGDASASANSAEL